MIKNDLVVTKPSFGFKRFICRIISKASLMHRAKTMKVTPRHNGQNSVIHWIYISVVSTLNAEARRVVLRSDSSLNSVKGMRIPRVRKKITPHILKLILKIPTPSSLLHPSSVHQPKCVSAETMIPIRIKG